jgi:hypothetical protein
MSICIDVTNEFNKFREAARHVWNTYFQEQAERNQNWDLRDEFSKIYVDLFNAIVKCGLPQSAPSIPHLWVGEVKVLSDYRVRGNDPNVPIMISRTIPSSGYWDYPVQRINSEQTDIRLISVFDWSELGFRDMRYFKVRIVASLNKDIVGRDALVEANNCRVLFEESKEKGGNSLVK